MVDIGGESNMSNKQAGSEDKVVTIDYTLPWSWKLSEVRELQTIMFYIPGWWNAYMVLAYKYLVKQEEYTNEQNR